VIQFGAWSTLLAVLGGQILLLAVLLLLTKVNRLANFYLAGLLAAIAGMLTPYVLGYAGFYDAYPWLTSAPFAVPLALGALLYAHVYALTFDRSPGWLHFAPAAAQFAYQAILFPFPVATKWWWDQEVHQQFLAPALTAAVLLSMAAYAIACWRLLDRYQAWLRDRRRDQKPAGRIRFALLVLAPLVMARAGYDLFSALVRPLDYFDMFGFYVLLGTTGLLLGLEGWRNAQAEQPPIAEPHERDWHAQGAEWTERMRSGDWWRDPSLDLATLARYLGTNSSHLSRALNDGHGGFAGVLANLRAEAVAAAIDRGSDADLLTLALDAGFGSKASFNRAFRQRFGVTPSAYRQGRVSQDESSSLHARMKRTSA
jgi:AraC-like DNA-binding protein